jgi:hypothetical protein
MRKFMIERSIPGVGALDACGLAAAARKSNAVLAELGPRIQWQHSYVAGDKTYCVYLAEDPALIQAHAERSGFPATCVTEIVDVIDPSTALR